MISAAPLFILLVFGTGFLLPLRARSLSALGRGLLINIALLLAVFLLAAAGGFWAGIALAITPMFFAAGAAAGHLTRLVLLLKRWPIFSLAGLATVAVGAALLPAAWAANVYYRGWQSGEIYARLPKATELPDIPACARFRGNAPLLDTLLTRKPGGMEPGMLPTADTPFRYPAPYADPAPPRFPKSDDKASHLEFEMYVADASPAPPEDEWDASGKRIPLIDRRASVSFRIFADRPVARWAAGMLNFHSSGAIGKEILPDIELAPSAVPGLEALRNPVPKTPRDTDYYIAVLDGEITDMVECTGHDGVPNPLCTFRFDIAGVPVSGRFRRANLADWGTIRENVRNFVQCSVEAGKYRDGSS